MKQILFETDDYQVLYERNSEIDKKIVDKILEIFKENNCINSETTYDTENLQIEAINYFCDFADMLKLSYKEK